jgi:pyrimidine-nucleoside phosphorylase
MKKEDQIDNTVGIVLNKKISDKIKKGDILAYIHSNDIKKLKEATSELKDIIKISAKNQTKKI